MGGALQESLGRKGTAVIRVVSLGADKTNRGATFDVDLCELTQDGKPIPYQAARKLFKEDPSRRYPWPSWESHDLILGSLSLVGVAHTSFDLGANCVAGRHSQYVSVMPCQACLARRTSFIFT